MRKQSVKSISFFMELLIVIFFFTLAACICVMVMSQAKEKSNTADTVKATLLYGQNFIEERNAVLYDDEFQFNEDGEIVDNGMYKGVVHIVNKGEKGDLCELQLMNNNDRELAVLRFYREAIVW